MIKDFKVSKYYTFYEVTNTSHIDLIEKNRIEAVPFIITLHDFLSEVIDPLCDRFGKFTISSGFRYPELNRRVGGSPISRHTLGLAVDIVGKDWGFDDFDAGMEQVAIDAIRMNLPFHRLILEKRVKTNARWVHISGGSNDKKVFTGIDGRYIEKEFRIL